MGKIIPVDKFELWWRKAQAWLAIQFASINVDLTPVEEKVDEVKETTAKETTAQEIKELIINEGIKHADEYASEIREIIGDWNNE